jgi:hypothetical protein
MPRKVFTAGEVLAASDVNEFLQDQAVMSFAGTAARGSAIGTAVEGMVTYLNDSNSLSVYNGTDWTIDRTIQVFAGTAARGSAIPSPVEGMYAHLNDTDTLQYYNGSAWANAGALGGLELIKAQTIGSAVSSVVVTDVFSSTYDNYRIVLSGGATSVSYANIGIQLGSTTTGYGHALYYIVYGTSETGIDRTGNGSSWANTFAGQPNGLTGSCDVISPNLAKNSFVSFVRATTSAAAFGSGYLNDTTQYTSFTIIPTSGTLTGGTIAVYGYKKA